METADKAISKWSIEDIKCVIEMEKAEALAYAENLERNENVTKQVTETADFAAQESAKDTKIAELEQELQKVKEEKTAKEINDFCEQAGAKGNILPAQKDKVVNILQSCAEVEMNFSEDESKPETMQLLKDFITEQSYEFCRNRKH